MTNSISLSTSDWIALGSLIAGVVGAAYALRSHRHSVRSKRREEQDAARKSKTDREDNLWDRLSSFREIIEEVRREGRESPTQSARLLRSQEELLRCASVAGLDMTVIDPAVRITAGHVYWLVDKAENRRWAQRVRHVDSLKWVANLLNGLLDVTKDSVLHEGPEESDHDHLPSGFWSELDPEAVPGKNGMPNNQYLPEGVLESIRKRWVPAGSDRTTCLRIQTLVDYKAKNQWSLFFLDQANITNWNENTSLDEKFLVSCNSVMTQLIDDLDRVIRDELTRSAKA